MVVLGVDGCPGGWVGALVDGDKVSWHAGSLERLLELPAEVVAVDIPLGLPTGATRRACDLLAASRLGAQRSSVFPAPPRAVLSARDHADASRRSRAAGSVGVSIQTWNIVPKIAEADALTDPRLIEVHPEVSFRELTGQVLPRKKLLAGRLARLEALQGWRSVQLPSPRPGRAAPDDCLDALICAWTAQRWLAGTAIVLGGDLDPAGRVMRIVAWGLPAPNISRAISERSDGTVLLSGRTAALRSEHHEASVLSAPSSPGRAREPAVARGYRPGR